MLQASTLMAQQSIDDTRKAEIDAAVSAWQASAPKASRQSGTRNAEGAGIPLTFTCSCGWSNTDRTNPNSAKWSYYGHLVNKKNGHGFTERPNKGNLIDGLIKPVFYTAAEQGGKQSIGFDAPDGKGYTVTVERDPSWIPPTAPAQAPAA